MPEPTYTEAQLRELLRVARLLGYHDDAAHWLHLLAARGVIA